MKKLALIIPYFGKFSAMFPLWLKSAAANPTVDFLMYTDNPAPENLSKNVKWHITTLQNIKKLVEDKCGFKVNLKSAYKLCDIRPAYGDIFYDDIKDYDFWGFCDVDLIFGNIRKFVTEKDLEEYDKIQELGHFVLVKNIPELRTAYKSVYLGEQPYKVIFRAKYHMSFDEGGDGEFGFPNIVKSMGYKRLFRRDFFDIKTNDFLFKHKAYKDGKPYMKHAEFFVYDNGKLFAKNQNEKELEERMYVHFQGRPMANYVDVTEDKFYAIPNAFVPNIEQYSYEEFENKERARYNKKVKKAKRYRLKRKFYLFFYLTFKGKIFNKNWRLYVMGGGM